MISGRFARASTANCQDVAQNCQNLTNYCRNSDLQAFMRQNCRLSCNFCFETPNSQLSSQLICEDKGSNCAQNSNLCFSRLYQKMMRENCLRTCNYCQYAGFGWTNPPEQPASCVDRNIACASWAAKNFCASRFYSQSVKEQECAKTCRFC